ncbi:MAG: hypothetical protein KIS87_01165 [Phycisphaeraceae bacterium]|nr:hypothetical protein [Phycisphaeraceae bacterium]
MNTQQRDAAGRSGERRRGPRLGMAVCVLAPSILASQPVAAQNLFFGSAGFNGSQDALYTTDLDGLGLSNILPSPMVVSGVAADGGQRLVFWKNSLTGGQHGSYSLHVSDFSGGSHAVIASWSGAGNNYGVAVDRLNRHVYWTDLAGVKRANYDGTGATSVVASFNAEDVEVDGAANKVFWSDSWGGSAVNIYSANLNGTNQTTLATFPGGTIILGLTIDPGTQTVFWSDYYAGTISAIPYAGGTPTTILSGRQFVAGLEYEPVTNRLYVVERGSAAVSWLPPTGGSLTTVFVGSGSTLGEMLDVAAIVPAPGTVALLALSGLIAFRRVRRPLATD